MSALLRRAYNWALGIFRFMVRYGRRTFRGTVRYARVRKSGAPIRQKTVFFEAYRAVKIADTPYAMFKAMLADPYYRDFTFIWAIDDEDNHYRKQYASLPNVKFVKFHSRAYVKALYTSKYVVNNKAWPAYFTKRPEQVHVTTWHATAFKALGKEQGGTIGQFKNVTRNYIQADYLVMPNRFTSEVMLRSNDVKGIFPGVVLEEGYPRLDLTVNADRVEMCALLERVCGVDPGKKVILYAPTWRGETSGYQDTTDEAIDNVKALLERLPDGYELLLKVHDLTYRHLTARDDLLGIKYVPDWVETNELLAAVDVLVTDYSSIFFDFLVLGRPVIFFAYDLDEYIADRGLYFDMEELPGPLCLTADEVASAIEDLEGVEERYAETYAAMLEEYCPGRDGKASERVCDVIFKGAPSLTAYRSFDQDKTRILVAGCSFDRSTQAYEIINFSRRLDYSRYDLSVLFGGKITPDRERHLRMLDSRARVFYSPGYRPLTFTEYRMRNRHVMNPPEARCAHDEVERIRPIYENERRRLLGDTPFDVAMCLTDELNGWTYLLSVCDFGKRVMWLPESTEDDEKRLPAEFVAERFDAILFTPEVAESRLIRALGPAKDGAGDAHETAVRLVPTQRFAGFERSIETLYAEVSAQLGGRIREAVRIGRHVPWTALEHEERDRIEATVESRLNEIAEGLSRHVTEVHASLGLDPVRRNAAIMRTIYSEIGASTTTDETPEESAADPHSQAS